MQRSRPFFFIFLLSALLACLPAQAQHVVASSAKTSQRVLDRAQRGEVQNLIIEYAAGDIEIEINAERSTRRLRWDDGNILQLRQQRYRDRKQQVDAALQRSDVDVLIDYSHLPMAAKRFRSQAALQAYLADARVVAIYEDTLLVPVLSASLPLVSQPAVSNGGASASGSTIAIVDTAIDYTLPAFGSCTAVNTPASCIVNASVRFGSGSSTTTHGSNVAAIAAAVASGAKIAALDVFSGTNASSSSVINAINWSISNQATYNITALNMSLGDGVQYSSPCSGSVFRTPVNNARAAGISVVAAAGNNAFTAGLSAPACTPGVISVGAVYDANVGALTWNSGLCTDNSTSADKITCFSNSASYLSLLAPGALITAAGSTMGGTSQAAPHVTGAVALLRALYGDETLDATRARLTENGISIADARNAVATPRLNLLASVRPANDDFANRVLIDSISGAITGNTRFASTQSGEPVHASNASAQSVWWQWTAPASGQLSIDTHGSAVDTVLAIYQGGAVNTLLKMASNDNDGSANGASSVLWQAQAGQLYQIAIDGVNAAAGAVDLNWSLNTAAVVNLAVGIAGPQLVSAGDVTNYTITASNAGPQTATNVVITYALPEGATVASVPAGCMVQGNALVCSIGALVSGANTVLTVTLSWDGAAHDAAHTVTINSDVPDSGSADNTTTLATVSQVVDSADVPLLPPWALVVLAVALMSRAMRERKHLWR